jgi:ChrR Cupin-like domain
MTTDSRPEYRFDDRDIHWLPFRGFEGCLDYKLLKVDEARGQVDLLMRFAPNQNCVPHRHVGPTKTLVLEGEHRVYRPSIGGGVSCSIRKAGTFSSNEGDETHFEGGGPQGAIILLSMSAVDGNVYDILDELGGAVTREIRLADFRRGYERQEHSAA